MHVCVQGRRPNVTSLQTWMYGQLLGAQPAPHCSPMHCYSRPPTACPPGLQDGTIGKKNSPGRNLHRLMSTLDFILHIFKVRYFWGSARMCACVSTTVCIAIGSQAVWAAMRAAMWTAPWPRGPCRPVCRTWRVASS